MACCEEARIESKAPISLGRGSSRVRVKALGNWGWRASAKKSAEWIRSVSYGDSDRIIQSQLAAQLLAQHGKTLDYLLGCTGCAPAAVLPAREAGLNGKLRIVAFDLTREIAGLVRAGDIVAAADTKGVSQARVAIGSAVNYLEGRMQKVPHTILVKLGLVDASNLAAYPFDTSTAPEGFKPNLSYIPPSLRKSF